MADFNENWERWCVVSINKHFDEGKGDTDCFIEGFTRDTNDRKDYIEVRVDGPDVKETTRGKWSLRYEVNILIVVKKDHQDVYRLNRLKGRVVALFLDCIEVRRWGNGPEDDQQLLGCLNLLTPQFANEKIQTSNFGKIHPSTDIVQASVEGHYILRID